MPLVLKTKALNMEMYFIQFILTQKWLIRLLLVVQNGTYPRFLKCILRQAQPTFCKEWESVIDFVALAGKTGLLKRRLTQDSMIPDMNMLPNHSLLKIAAIQQKRWQKYLSLYQKIKIHSAT